MLQTNFCRCLAVLVALTLPGGSPASSGDGSSVPSKQNLDLPFDAVSTEEEEEEAPEVIVFWNGRYEGDFFCFVCDKSGSMEGKPWVQVQEEVVRTVKGFSEKVEFAIVLFDASLVVFPRSDRPARATAEAKAAAEAMVTSTTTGHGSCYQEALLRALLYSDASMARRRQIICLGDGETTCLGRDRAVYGRETLSAVSGKNHTAHINTIGYSGTTGLIDEAWLKALAAQNGGSYRRA
jgi:hypothetical protein